MADQQKTQLLEALNALYHHPEQAVQQQAGKWLEDWQNTPQAWSLADTVLHDQSTAMDAQYFCAQTLRTKVQRDFDELPQGAADELRRSLVALVLRFSRGAPPVRTQLCLALAAMSPHMPASTWGERGVVGWLAQNLGKENVPGSLSCLLEMLTVIPQEAGTYKAAIRPERRREYTAELMACCPSALELLIQCMNSGQTSESREVLEAFQAWMRLSGGTGMDGATLAQHPLTQTALKGLQSTESFEAAVDVICELVWATVGPQQPGGGPAQPLPHMMPLVQVLVQQVLALRPRFNVAAARARDESVAKEHEHWDDDEDTAKGMARCFAEIGEAFMGTILQATPEVVAVVEALLDVAAYPEDHIAAISFNFWNCLASALVPRRISDVPESEVERRRQVFAPAFEKLVVHIQGRVRFPEEHSKMSKDDQQEFRRARYSIADTLEDAATVIGGQRILELMVGPLQEMSTAIVSGHGNFDWRTAESALYCIRSVHRSAPMDANPVMVSLFQMLPKLPSVPGCASLLLYTVALMVGAYSDWIKFALDGGLPPQVLQELLVLLTGMLSNTEAASAGALAIRHLCDSCRMHLVGSAQSLIQLHEATVPSGIVAGDANATKLALDSTDAELIVEGVTLVLAAMPAEELSNGLNALLSPITNLLEVSCTSLPAGASMAHFSLSLIDSPQCSATSRASPARAPHCSLIASALGHCWPLVEKLLDKSCGDQVAMEAVCKAPGTPCAQADGRHSHCFPCC